MITVKIDISSLKSVETFKRLASEEGQTDLKRAIAISMLPIVHDRIHVRGEDASGGQIGTYSKGYMVVRTGAYKNAVSFKKGKNKGKQKNSGVFTASVIKINKESGIATGDEKFGTARPNYNRSGDTKVILSLTRQMESDFSVVAENDKYGLGFKNDHNFDKATWVEATYNKKIYTLQEKERDLAISLAQDYTNAVLK